MGKFTTQEIENKLIQEIAVILSADPATIKPDVPLHTLGLDSMSFVEVLVFIEKTFGLQLIESGLTREDFATIQALARVIAAKTQAT
jgi:acyl carrier protein